MRAVTMTVATAAHRALDCTDLAPNTSKSVRSPLPMSAKELHRVDLKCDSQFLEHVDACSVMLVFQKAGIFAVETGTIRQLLLRPAA